METLYQILGIVSALLIIYLLVRMIKGRPELFTKDSLSKSFLTMGVLGVALMAFIAMLVLFLNQT
ncbi:MAG: hypothetical protein CK426_08365 [Legionella sp.]|nr:MAG: hypothetical protein CK423_01270 [Legionella sp.]PJD97442.1 MAG: hypothetical protein CK426_08365 [Legionella sp.]